MNLPVLSRWLRPTELGVGGQRNSTAPRHAIVFVHGIISRSTDTFELMHARFSEDRRFDGFEFFFFHYDFWLGIEDNGEAFAKALAREFKSTDLVTIIAHSMGGLVSRLAVLSQPLPAVACLFLLGTPNVGAVRICQLTMLSQLSHAVFGTLSALYPRRKGISDLTKAAQIMESHESKSANAAHVAYISIPGLYFRDDRYWFARPATMSARMFTRGLRIIGLFGRLIPPLRIEFLKPHDGVVEESSNKMFPVTAGRTNEKKDSINELGGAIVSYAHVEVTSCGGLTHIDLQKDREVFEVVAELALTVVQHRIPAKSPLVKWKTQLKGVSKSRVVRADFQAS